MPERPSKKQLILDELRARNLQRVGEHEIRAIQAEIRRRLGPDKAPSLSYIASVAGEAGIVVADAGRFASAPLDEPYASRLEGVLQFHDLASAEESLRRLDAIYREYSDASDRRGATLVRDLILKGKQRAASLGSSSRVRPEKRREKHEIATWFRVWLETPDLFFDWLELRKQSDEFRAMFIALRASEPEEHG